VFSENPRRFEIDHLIRRKIMLDTIKVGKRSFKALYSWHRDTPLGKSAEVAPFWLVSMPGLPPTTTEWQMVGTFQQETLAASIDYIVAADAQMEILQWMANPKHHTIPFQHSELRTGE
jgi:hypothetical protein